MFRVSHEHRNIKETGEDMGGEWRRQKAKEREKKEDEREGVETER